MDDEKLNELARHVTHSPKLTVEYIKNPDKLLARTIPRQGLLERISMGVPARIRDLRAELGDKVEALMSEDLRLVSAREAYFENKMFLNESLRNAQRSFNAIFWFSCLAFIIGLSLLVGAFLGAFLGGGTTEKALLGGLSGGGGAFTTLSTLIASATKQIRKANGDSAQINLILTSFATEIITLRALPFRSLKQAQATNEAIREAMTQAVETIEEYVEPLEKRKGRPKEERGQAETVGD